MEKNEYKTSKGFRTVFTKVKPNFRKHKENGNLVMESRKARNEVLKLRGCRDNDAGYGDYSGEHN